MPKGASIGYFVSCMLGTGKALTLRKICLIVELAPEAERVAASGGAKFSFHPLLTLPEHQ